MERTVYDRMAEIQAHHWWYEGRRRILRDVIRTIDLPPNAKILEAGCGPGANLAMLGEFGEVSAFEPDEPARAHAAAHSEVEPLIGWLPDRVPFEGPFDLVAAFDVVEHVDDDAGACATLRELLHPGGVGLFTVPAFPSLWSEHDVSNHHFRRYRRPEFAALLREAGFKDIRISHFNTVLFPAVAGVRGMRRLSGRSGPGDDTMPRYEVVNRGLTAVFATERHLVTRVLLPVGVSLLAQARR